MKPTKHTKRTPNEGGSFTEFLEEEGVLPEVTALALKRTLALQLQDIIAEQKISNPQLAKRMHTSRAAVDRILNPDNPSLTVASVGKAAAALGKKVEVRFVSV